VLQPSLRSAIMLGVTVGLTIDLLLRDLTEQGNTSGIAPETIEVPAYHFPQSAQQLTSTTERSQS
jgi:Fe2+ transport system protein B